MDPIGSSPSSPADVVSPWRRILPSSWFLGILLAIPKSRKGASSSAVPLLQEQSPLPRCVALPPNTSPEAVEFHDHTIEIPRDDEESRLLSSPARSSGSSGGACGAPPKHSHSRSISVVLGADAKNDLNTPFLHWDLKLSLSFPAYKAISRQTPAKEGAECTGGSHYAITIHSDHDEEEQEESVIHEEDAVISVRDQYQLDRDGIRLLVKKKNLSLLRRSGGVRTVASVLQSDLERGITAPGGQDSWVPNRIPPTPARLKGYLYFLLDACNRWIIILLTVAAILSFLTEFMAQGLTNGWHNGTAIVAAIILLVTVPSAVKYYRAKRLQKELLEMTNLQVSVKRGGEDRLVLISEVVEGDVVRLEKGRIIPADGLFIDGDDLVLDEALNPKINPDQNPFLFSGSRVISGTGTMLVTSTVDRNALLVKELSGLEPNRPSLLEDRVNKPNEQMEILALLLSLFILVQALVQVLLREHGVHGEKPDLKGEVSVKQVVSLFTKILLFPRGTIQVLTSSLAVMVIGLQHGVPLTITLSLAYWNSKAVSAKIQNLWACVTIGIVTVLYVDTTCGILCDQMEVTQVWLSDKEITCEEDYLGTPDSVLESLHQAIEVSARVPEISASPRNSMLIHWANSKWGLTDKFGNSRYDILDFKNLSSGRKGRGTLMRKEGSADEEAILHLHWKGAASSILDMCSHYTNQAGMRCFLENRKAEFENAIKDMEEKGLVTIAFATREADEQEITENGLSLLAILGLKLIISEDDKEAVRYLRRMGICIVLVSEDEPSTLRSMACELGSGGSAEEAMKEIIVMEGLKPEENFSFVSSLKEKGEVVAFYGGSTTDGPTLKEADLGITDRDTSTQMAKDSADIVLDRGIASLIPLMEFGCYAYSNIQIFTRLQLSTWISWFILTLVVTILSGDSPIALLQQIWIYAVMCFLGGLMMMMELGLPSLIAQRLAPRTDALVKKLMWIEIAKQITCQLLVFFLFQFKGQDIPGVTNGVHGAMMFTSFTLCQVLNQVIATKTGRMEQLGTVLSRHHCFLAAVGAVVVVQVLMVQFMQSLADGLPLSAALWMLTCGVAVLPLILFWAGAFLLSAMSFTRLPTLSTQRWFIIPCSMFFLVSASQIIQPVGDKTYR